MNCEHEAVASIHEEVIMHKPKMSEHAITVKAAILAICTVVAFGFLYAGGGSWVKTSDGV